MTEVSDRDLIAFSDLYRSLNEVDDDETLAFMAILGKIWNYDTEDDDALSEFSRRMSITLMMVADTWRKNGIPDAAVTWTEEPA